MYNIKLYSGVSKYVREFIHERDKAFHTLFFMLGTESFYVSSSINIINSNICKRRD